MRGRRKINIYCLILIFSVAISVLYFPVPCNIAEAATTIYLSYDDYYSFSSDIDSIKTVSIQSYKVGGKTKDKAVLKKISQKTKEIVAVGCGTAKVKLKNKKTYIVQVSPAPISLLLLVGQSNMEGTLTKKAALSTAKKQWIQCEKGTVYSSYAPWRPAYFKTVGFYNEKGFYRTINNVQKFIPGTLTKVDKKYKWKNTNNLTTAKNACGKSGIDAGLGYQWYQSTGEKVWLINCARAGTSIKQWQKSEQIEDNLFWQSVYMYQAAEAVLEKEIAAGHYTLSHKGIFWCQGEEDTLMGAEEYKSYFHKLIRDYQIHLHGTEYQNVSKTIEFVGVFMVRSYFNYVGDCFYMTGPRVALYEMTNSTSAQDGMIYLASDLEEKWSSDKKVKKYFKSKYRTNQRYNKLTPTKDGNLKMPTTVKEVWYKDHFTQLARNEIGRDGAANICKIMGYNK